MRMLGDNISARIAEIEQKADEFSKIPIVYKGDWYEISEPVEYFSNPVNPDALITTNTTHTDFTKLFSKGDPVRLKQGGSYKYFFVNRVFTNGLYLFAGTSFALTSDPITDFARGLKVNPIGLPDFFEWDPVPVSGFPGTMTISISSTTGHRFSVNGNRIFLYLSQDITLGGTAVSTILINAPLSYAYSSYGYEGMIVMEILNGGSYKAARAFRSGTDPVYIVIENFGSTPNLSLGQMTYDFSMSFTF